jgi:hypothetical protein
MAIYNEPLATHLATIKQICGWIDPALPAFVDHIDTTTPLLPLLAALPNKRFIVDAGFVT